MALPLSGIWEVRTAGSDNSGGLFDPSATMAADLAATAANTAAPVVTSASYTFTASDVGAWLFVKSGTNWTPGWYPIASVSAGAATLTASVGSAVLYGSNFVGSVLSVSAVGPSTAAGCATVASPTAGSWAIDYSQQSAARLSYTDLVIGATTTQLTSAANPFTAAMPGNTIGNVAGTGFTAGWFNVRSVSGSTATMDRSVGTAASSSGTGNLGGSMASPGKVAGLRVTGNAVWIQYNAAGWTTSATSNVAGGRVADSVGSGRWAGYETLRTDRCPNGNRPTFNAGAASQVIFAFTSSHTIVENLKFANPSAFATVGGLSFSSLFCSASNCVATGCTTNAIACTGSDNRLADCLVSGGSGTSAFHMAGDACSAIRCTALAFAGTGFTAGSTYAGVFVDCAAVNCSGTSGFGFANAGGHTTTYVRCLAHGNSKSGFNTSTQYQVIFDSCVASGNTQFGFVATAGNYARLNYCASYSNTSGAYDTGSISPEAVVGFQTLTADPWTNAAGLDFTTNSASGGGARLRATAPSTRPGLAGTSYGDLGPFQSPGGGTAYFAF